MINAFEQNQVGLRINGLDDCATRHIARPRGITTVLEWKVWKTANCSRPP